MDYTDNLQSGLPLGLAFGMAMDEQAINHYGKMTEYEKEQVIARSKDVKSKEEMQHTPWWTATSRACSSTTPTPGRCWGPTSSGWRRWTQP